METKAGQKDDDAESDDDMLPVMFGQNWRAKEAFLQFRAIWKNGFFLVEGSLKSTDFQAFPI